MVQHIVTRPQIEEAAKRIKPYVVETPLLYSPQLSDSVGVDVYLKCENLQRTGAFKLRGALNKLLSMRESGDFAKGVITASSGNHGQAVAYAAKLLDLPCTVVVPEDVLSVKEQAIVGFGAQVIHCGVTSSARIDLATELAVSEGLVFIPPYDDLDIMAGQGTVGAEIARQCPQVKTVIVPVGGGGLTAGVSTAIRTMLVEAKVFAAEPSLANDTFLSRKAGRIVDIGSTSTIADGLRTSHPGTLTFPILQRNVDDVLLVKEEAIARALGRILMDSKLLVEPSGATSVAALLESKIPLDGPVVCVLSGGNVEWETVKRLLS